MGNVLGMSADTRPNSDAIVATLTTADEADRVVAAIAEKTGVAAGDIAHGTGESFAHELEGGDRDDGSGSRLGKWLRSLGQDREELMEKGQEAREGYHVLVVNGVTDDQTKEAVIAVLQDHDADNIFHFGDWQNEDIL
ncbi:hypothetical protein BH23ACT9_BH23ACT9_14350 [soil metagenome]